ncbi:hypothetical protein GLOTRDRAFT_125998 [Gloeophyllum trabeum ATCC 11539]|uniref:Uncharacterized protein n=1 Tax=Gloeophyllum trabeum (strain ATCC 11539 / FP-39264 / Madison 617) TaxID=670483 RepID=S7RXP1_GLOTA|nr:uncharacterized protein GLOTRDRAFT_125998 [Gloeophyllum trabeum ATCC 11539]EPQ59700.1 hypothetical protein GLOTRDRAFT_125998 [Gloeophyllum trabeum ATCC 11539]
MTVDYRYGIANSSPDLCLPTVYDIEEEREEERASGVTIVLASGGTGKTPKERKRPKVSRLLEDLVFTLKLKCQKLRGTLVHSPKQSLEVDLLS